MAAEDRWRNERTGEERAAEREGTDGVRESKCGGMEVSETRTRMG